MNPELERLLSGLCDGNLNEHDRESLGAIIAADAAARQRYIEYVDLHAALSGPMGVAIPELSEPARPPRFTRKFWIASAVAYAALVVVGGLVWMNTRNGPLTWNKPFKPNCMVYDERNTLQLVEFAGRAELTGGKMPDSEAKEGDAVIPGQTLHTDGYAYLDFGQGSWLQLSPEAQLQFVESDRGGEFKVILKAGILRGEVKATDLLTVVTPQAQFHPNDARFLISATAPNVMETESPSASVLKPTATFKTPSDWGLAFASETRLVSKMKSSQYALLDANLQIAVGQPLPARTNDSLGAGLSGDAKTFFRVDKSGTVVLWNTATGDERGRIEVGAAVARWPWSVSHNGSTLAAAHIVSGPAIEVRFWNTLDGRELPAGKPSLTPRCFAVSADGTRAAWGIDGRKKQPHTLEIWDIAAGKMLATAEVPEKALRVLAFAPDGRTLSGATEQGAVHAWDCATGKLRNTFIPDEANPRPVSALAYSHGGAMLAAGRADGRVNLWNADTGKELMAFQSGTRTVTALAFSPSDLTLAIGLMRQNTTIWTVPKLGE